ncbi:MAG TPA: 30S ribosomal protein S6 [Candidatus Coatesbacteria bacterium]|nr:30S ribosomal protein S6 [Candidatus Coatesbacteria bacterium]
MRDYETTVVLSPELEADRLEAKLDGLRQLFGEGVEIKDQGVQKLAYPINHHTQARYLMVFHKNEPERIADIEAKLRLDESVIRFLTCRGE